ncbi:MAG: glycerol-3-phosphate 1-O-acyltransferase PlsY [Armatimonadota bacterium]|nr:glycerol-3-phosphate 1-O-acyltransferase PlsY [bacterium]
MRLALALASCYLLGSVPFGMIMGMLRKVDIRQYGSGNIGASNVLRILGTGPGVLVLVLDTLKGFAAVMICKALGLDAHWVVAGALCGILGHTFSVFLRFRGGKGVATSLGVIFGLNWLIALIAFALWVILVGITRYISLASIIATISVPSMMFFWKSQHVPVAFQALAVVAALAIVVKHTSNVKRLLSGTEAKIGERVDITKKKEEQSL